VQVQVQVQVQVVERKEPVPPRTGPRVKNTMNNKKVLAFMVTISLNNKRKKVRQRKHQNKASK
jgi:hypothetical protein